MRPKSSPKLMLLMTLPVFALLIVGWFLREKRGTFTPPLPQNGPLRMVVTDVKFEELKPREVAEGFDTKVTVTVDLKGQRPKFGAPFTLQLLVPKVNLKYADSMRAETQLQEFTDYAVNSNGLHRRYFHNKIGASGPMALPSQCSFLFKRRKLARKNIDVFLQSILSAELRGAKWFKYKERAPFLHREAFLKTMKPIFWQFKIHKAGDNVVMPMASNDTRIEITKTGTKNYAASDPLSNPPFSDSKGLAHKAIEATIHYQAGADGLRHAPRIETYDIYLQDENGKKYRSYRQNGNERNFTVGGSGWGRPTSGPNSEFYKPLFELDSRFPVTALPKKAKQLTFKFKISVDDAWPTQVSVVVRK